MTTRSWATFVLLVGVSGGGVSPAADLDRPPIQYSTAATDNAVTRLERQLKAKAVGLIPDDGHGYPLSYVVYSRQFDGLPAEAKERIFLRLWEVLTGKDGSKPFAHLSKEDRGAVLEILRETKPDLPTYWKK